ncbi:DUF2612 domain-containing protein [Brevibacillus ruminantium]|uniref:DUF2612 domain-containing protein n=1 Tax=Brevibacillus ruminantium TaxID=2950604 RepID=A0ABY4WDL8_9BACL|nr:DUF2612 domain-containing protein [Brevibacillus ruminantium]USG65152.1 DUF2612 domain-containing protein [Brevibacillus ruminantium]
MIQQYLDLITSQHCNKDKFMSWLTVVLERGDAAVTVVSRIPEAFDVNKAVGVQLDTVGDLVGRSRYLPFQLADGSSPVLDDDNYRIALKAKIAQNQWDGTIPQIYKLWDDLFPSARLRLFDNQDMTMKAKIRGDLGLHSVLLVTLGYIIPKPSGVRINIAWESEIDRMDYVGMLVSGRDTITIESEMPQEWWMSEANRKDYLGVIVSGCDRITISSEAL